MSAGMNRLGLQIGLRLGLRIGAVALALGAVACIDDFDTVGDGQFGSGGPSCASVCERAEECEGSGSSSECTEQCNDLERVTRRAGCEREWEVFLDCISDTGDVCSGEACGEETIEFSECISPYCERNFEECTGASDG